MQQYRLFIAVVMASFVAAHPAFAQPIGAPHDQCFRIEEFQSWRAPDARTIYIRVLSDNYYRLDLAETCPALKTPDAHLITHTRGPDSVCSAIDWDLKVSEGPSFQFSEPCIVKTMTPLTPADVAAIPKGFKP
jgi:uncharacterized protein DUF6491